MSDRIKELIEQELNLEGFTAKSWREHPDDGLTAVLGRFVVIEDDEDHGIYLDDEGEVTACVVGAEKYNNERVCFTFTADGQDVGSETWLSLLDPIDS